MRAVISVIGGTTCVNYNERWNRRRMESLNLTRLQIPYSRPRGCDSSERTQGPVFKLSKVFIAVLLYVSLSLWLRFGLIDS